MKYEIANSKVDKGFFSELYEHFRQMEGANGLDSDTPIQFTMGTKATNYNASFSLNGEPKLEGEALKQAQSEGVRRIKVMIDRELGDGAGQRLFNSLAMNDVTSVTGAQLQALGGAYMTQRMKLLEKVENAKSENVKQWQAVARNPGQVQDTSSGQTLQELLQNPQAVWKVSESGMTGAIIVSLPGGKGAVIKIEERTVSDKTASISGLMGDTLNKEGGFVVPKAVSMGDLTGQDQLVNALAQKLEQIRDGTTDQGLLLKINPHIQNLRNTPNIGSVGISKMEFVPGVQLNKLPMEDKAALLRTGALAEQLGKAAILCPMTGLKDHVSCAGMDYNAQTNLSNFMIDPRSGKLAPIDLDAKNLNELQQNAPPRYGIPEAGTELGKVANFVKDSTASPEALQTAIQNMVKQQEKNIQDDTISPMRFALCSLTQPEVTEGLVNQGAEARLLMDLTNSPEIKERQAVSMMKGLVSGLKYVKENSESLSQAFQEHGHGMTQEEFNTLAESVNTLDIGKMEQQVADYETKMLQKWDLAAKNKQEMDRQVVEPELAKLAKLQKRLGELSQEKPSLKDRFQAFFKKGGIDSMKSEVHSEIEKLKVDITRKVDARQFQQRVESNRQNLDTLIERKEQLRVGAKEYVEAKQLHDQQYDKLARHNINPGDSKLSEIEVKSLENDVKNFAQIMDSKESAFKEFAKIDKDIKEARGIRSHGDDALNELKNAGKKVRDGVQNTQKTGVQNQVKQTVNKL